MRCDIKYLIVRLGEFHTRMIFLGCVVYIKVNSGLLQAFELMYAGNATLHLLSGKALGSMAC